jgi:hypothetical protein
MNLLFKYIKISMNIAVVTVLALMLTSCENVKYDTLNIDWLATFNGGVYSNVTSIKGAGDKVIAVSSLWLRERDTIQGVYGVLSLINQNGVKQWSYPNLESTYGDDYYDISVLSTGDYLVVGNRSIDIWNEDAKADGRDPLLIKYDSKGNILWEKVLKSDDKTSDFEKLTTNKKDESIIVRIIETYRTRASILYKYNSDGEILWEKDYSGLIDAYWSTITCASDGGYVLGGGIIRGDESKNNKIIQLMKINEDGEILWNKSYETFDSIYAYDIIETSDNSYVIVCQGLSEDDGIIAKFDSDGEKQFIKKYKKEFGYPYAIIETADGGLVTAGIVRTEDDSDDGIIVRFDENVENAKVYKFGGSGNDRFLDIIQNEDGSFIAAGRFLSNDGDLESKDTDSDDVIIKFTLP